MLDFFFSTILSYQCKKARTRKRFYRTSVSISRWPLYPAKLSFSCLIFVVTVVIVVVVIVYACVCVCVWMWSRCGEEKFYSVRVETLIKPCYCLYVVYYFQFCMVPRRENYQMTQSLLPDLTSNVQFVNVWMTECDPPLDEYRGELNASIWLGFMWEST